MIASRSYLLGTHGYYRMIYKGAQSIKANAFLRIFLTFQTASRGYSLLRAGSIYLRSSAFPSGLLRIGSNCNTTTESLLNGCAYVYTWKRWFLHASLYCLLKMPYDFRLFSPKALNHLFCFVNLIVDSCYTQLANGINSTPSKSTKNEKKAGTRV